MACRNIPILSTEKAGLEAGPALDKPLRQIIFDHAELLQQH